MKEIISNVEGDGLTPKDLAWTSAEVASYNSLDKDGDTPFAQTKRFAGRGQDKGGKYIVLLIESLLSPESLKSSIRM